MSEVVDAEVVEEPGTDLATPAPGSAATLFRTDDPATVLRRATETANELAPVLRAKGMVSPIQGKEHVNVEGWQTLGAMLGVTPVTTDTRQVGNGWEAVVEARTLDGRVIGAAESMCSRDEARWKDADEYAIRSMAQTRATSRALASVLRFVVTLAGFSGTPAEEMGGRGYGNSGGNNPDRPASERQRNYVASLMDKADFTEAQLALIRKWSRGERGLKASAASFLIENLRDGTAEGRSNILTTVGFSDTPADTADLDEPEGEQPADEDLPPF